VEISESEWNRVKDNIAELFGKAADTKAAMAILMDDRVEKAQRRANTIAVLSIAVGAFIGVAGFLAGQA
jgi:formate/nitrite transporter FocA (FNT family)